MRRVATPAMAFVVMLGVCVLALSVLSTRVLAQSYSEWIQKDESWKRGYVHAYAESTIHLVFGDNPDERKFAEAYGKCLGGFTDQALVKTVDEYLSRNPSEKTKPVIISVSMAIRELCAKHLPKVN